MARPDELARPRLGHATQVNGDRTMTPRTFHSAIELFIALDSSRRYPSRPEYAAIAHGLERECRKVLLWYGGRAKMNSTFFELIDGEITISQVKDLNFVNMDAVTIGNAEPVAVS